MTSLVSVEEFSSFLRVDAPAGDSKTFAQMQYILTLASDWARELSGKPWLLPTDAPSTAKGIILAACRREWVNPKRLSYVVKGPQSATFMQAAYPPGFFSEAEENRFKAFRRHASVWSFDTYRDEPADQMNGYLEVYPHGGMMPVYHPYDLGWEESIHP